MKNVCYLNKSISTIRDQRSLDNTSQFNQGSSSRLSSPSLSRDNQDYYYQYSASNTKLRAGESPNFFTDYESSTAENKQNLNCQNVPSYQKHAGLGDHQNVGVFSKKPGNRHQRLMDMSKETLIKMLYDANQYNHNLMLEKEEIENKYNQLNRLNKSLLRDNSLLQEQIDQAQRNHHRRPNAFKIKRTGTDSCESSPFKTRCSTSQRNSAQKTKDSSRLQPNLQNPETFKQQIQILTNTQSPSEALARVKAFKQASKFVCSLYQLIDKHTHGSYFGDQYSLHSAWSFVGKVFEEHFNGDYIETIRVVEELQDILSVDRRHLAESVIQILRGRTLMNKALEQIKVRTGLTWIHDSSQLYDYLKLSNRQ